jgi:hypothetical protein
MVTSGLNAEFNFEKTNASSFLHFHENFQHTTKGHTFVA